MKKFKNINEQEMMGDDIEIYADELLSIQTWYNQEDQRLKNMLAKKRNDALIKYQQRAKIQATQKTTPTPSTNTIAAAQQPKTGTVTTAGQPVNAQGNPPTPTVESYSDILKIKELINEESFDTRYADSDDVQNLKDYMDAENISYIEDEDGTNIDFDKNELDPEWKDNLEQIGLEEIDDDVKTDDILDYTEDEETEEEKEIEDEEEDLADIHDKIDEEKVFYVKVTDADGDFTGKIYKLFDDGEWRAKIVDGNSGTFEKLNYEPSWDEHDIIAFLHENYDDAELISKDEFNDHIEEPEKELEVHESHKIQTYEEFLNEVS